VLPGPKRNGAAAAANGYIVVLRRSSAWDASDAEVVLINTHTADVVRRIDLAGTRDGRLGVSRDAQRLYYSYISADWINRSIEIRSLANGDVLARTTVPGYVSSLEVDERHASLITVESGGEFVARDLNTLARIGVIGVPSYWSYRTVNEVKRTHAEGTVLVSSDQWCSYCTGCWGPNIDVFDGRNGMLVKQVPLRRCSAMLPLPPR
jgi:hypothetical protein